MAINHDISRWTADVAASVDLYNDWFMKFAPKTYREKRIVVTNAAEIGFAETADLTQITPDVLKRKPSILPMLRMATCPPLARDRLMGLAYADRNLISCMELGACPSGMRPALLESNLQRIAAIISRLLDRDMFPWLAANAIPTDVERARAATIIADRMCGAQSDPIIRNAQEERQLKLITEYLIGKGYKLKKGSCPESVMEAEVL